MADKEKLNKLKPYFTKFVGHGFIAIIDPNPSNRKSILRVISSLGIEPRKIYVYSEFHEALSELSIKDEENLPKLLITEYNLKGRLGIELITQLKENLKSMHQSLFAIVTNNAKETSVIKALEEDIDTYILKPFSADILQYKLSLATYRRIRPSKFLKLVILGKEKLIEKDYENAKSFFCGAIKVSNEPSLGYYYLSQCYINENKLEEANNCLEKGLSFNQNSFHCLNELININYKSKNYDKAYEIILKFSEMYPLIPTRLKQTLQIMLELQKYGEIFKFYDIFKHFDTRDNELIGLMCGTLIKAARVFHQNGQNDLSVKALTNAASSSLDNGRIIKNVVLNLLEIDEVNLAHKYIERFPKESRDSGIYYGLKLALKDKTEKAEDVLIAGRNYLSKGYKDPLLYKIVIKRFIELGKMNSAEDEMYRAIKEYPTMKFEFQLIFKTNQKAS